MRFVEQYLLQLNTEKRRLIRAVLILTALSLIVVLVTVWNLRMTGITIANGATCGYKEHRHNQACRQDNEIICGIVEHMHEVACYSDPGADVEVAESWTATIPELTADRRADIVQIALSQLGYRESTLNFELANDGVTKNGITRYGQWYGNPYGDWANMFTAFCLRYAGLPGEMLNSGAEVMRRIWTEEDLYRSVGQYEPAMGDIVFLDRNQNGAVETTAIIASVEDEKLIVIEGNVDNTVAQRTYDLSDGVVVGYGITVPETQLIMFAAPAAGAVQGKALTLWLDGTNGNIMSYRGSDNTQYTVYSGVAAQLPSQWKSPTKYSYTLAGWVDVKTGKYYKPGAEITITENTVLYADWVASTYDIGVYNSYVVNTVSTNEFITTHVFDYSSLINLLSSKVTANATSSSHSETWSHVSSGTVSYLGQQTLNFSFNDHDSSGTITNLNNLNNPNKYTGGTAVYSGIYNAQLGQILFGTDNLFDPETGEGVVGKHYLGQGDHLFQINTDPTSEYYGYYYYDAKLNAASYNQTDQRFYVYDYLARTSDSANNNDAGKYSDFLPLNSPYANTNGQTIKTYNYAGENGEYNGVSHYVYDARYNSDGSATNQIQANLWFGMRVDVQFGLPDTPGVKLADGTYGNQDIYGNDMVFKFTGDDDVWVLVDGVVVLDLGGIHQASEGEINFTTGKVTVEGKTTDLKGISAGEHTLTILYLERGSSMSNCAIYFNLAPRFSLTLQKEDVLTQEVLNGAQFAFYYDLECTQPCDLWPSQQSYKNGNAPTNVFTIANGELHVWGLSPSRTYYIKEVKPPDSSGYDPAKGVIRLTLDKNGLNSYSATILEGEEGKISHGFTIHGFRIDEENQAAYIVITNAQNWVKETTSIYVEKKWNDNKDHIYDAVTVYLNVTDADGTVRRIREIVLSEENDWKYSWVNLPKYNYDPQTGAENKDDPVRYSVSEAYFPGYSPNIQQMESGSFTEEVWKESASFQNGEVYVLKTMYGCISAVSATSDQICFVDEETAKNSPLALWTATVSNGLVRLTNQAGQSLNFDRDRWRFNATANGAKMNLTPSSQSTGLILASSTFQNQWYTEVVYMTGTNNNGYLNGDGNSSAAVVIHPLSRQTETGTVVLEGLGYSITNTPLLTETSVKVVKRWDQPLTDDSLYEKAQVTIRLYANGVDTGRTETVSLKSDWTAVFSGLPYLDDEGEPIVYTVVETWETGDWIPVYGQVTSTGGNIPTYETIITNRYRWMDAFELPATGGTGNFLLVLCGLVLVIGPFVYGISMRRRYERRSKG